MLRVLFLVFGAVAAFFATAAVAADQPVYGPVEAWVKPLPIPKAGAGGDGGPTKVLLQSDQSRLTPEVDEYYTEIASQALSPQGLAALGNLQRTWDPATETLVIHRLQILRDGQAIDLLAGGHRFTVLRRETNLDSAMLDGRLTASFQPEGLRVGDVLDLAYTIQKRDPALHGYSTHFASLTHTGVASRIYLRTLWPSTLPIHWKQTEGLKPAVVSSAGGMTEVTVDETDVEAPKAPLGAPTRFADLGSIAFSQYRDWTELSALFAPIYDKASSLKPGSAAALEAARIAQSTKDPKARALAALRLVEDQVRYVFLGMEDGGLIPADADETWARRFGDCKGKTALLVALLRELGVEAEPALVNTVGGDGMDARLPTVGWFDHAIVRAHIGGKTYWLDGTRTGDRDLDSLQAPAYGWALPLRPAGLPLDRLDPPPLSEPNAENLIVIDASQGQTAPAKTHIEIIYHRDAAVSLRAAIAASNRADFERAIRASFARTNSWLDIATIDIRDEPAAATVRLVLDGVAKLDWTDTGGGSKIYRTPSTAFGGQVAKRQAGPHADAPYAVAYPAYEHNSWRITLPPGPRYTLFGANIDRTVAGIAMKRDAKIENGVLVIESSSRSMTPEFPASEADADSTAWRELSRSDVAVVAAPAGTATGATSPTGAGLQADQAAAQKGDAKAQTRLGLRYANGDGVAVDLVQALAWFRKAAAAGDVQGELQLGQALFFGHGTAADKSGAVVWFRKAADTGSAEGQRDMAYAYENGDGVARDYNKAIEWFSKAVAQGDARAESSLAHMYFQPVGVPRDVAKAMDLYNKAAAQKNPDAEYTIAMAALRGDGMPKDINLYRIWMKEAANQGLPLALFALGNDTLYGLNGAIKDPAAGVNMLETSAARGQVQARAILGYLLITGQNVAKDTGRGVTLLTGAAEQGYGPGQADLGIAYYRGADIPQDDAKAQVWLQKAADQHVPNGALYLAHMYRAGRAGAVDYAKALALYRQAADAGLIDAQGLLGEMYLNGQGAPADPAEAMTWFRKAADQGNAVSQRIVGSLYEAGRGVPKDDAQANAWYEKAAAGGDLYAMSGLGAAYINGRGEAKDPAKALDLLRKPAAAGIADAQANLGYLYDHGFGVPQDFAQAIIWYGKAAAQGHTMGEVNVGVMYSQGRGVAKDPARAFEMFTKAANKGNPIGERLLALAYLRGEGTPASRALGGSWLQRAAEQGDPESKRMLDLLMRNAPGAPGPATQATPAAAPSS